MVLAVASLSLPAFAQRSVDTYAAPRTLTLAAPALFSGGGAYTSGTNVWVDVKSFDGIAKIDFITVTNVANTTATFTVQGSMDQTNITTVGSASIASPTTVVYTNIFYGATNFLATNVWQLPGAIVNPTAATAGFSTAYLNALANPFTNSLSAASLNYNGVTTVGLSIGDSPRYLRVIITPGGAATNFTVGAVLTGFVHTSSYPF